MPRTSDLTLISSPSASATLVGVDEKEVDGTIIKETVQIPITEFAEAEHEHSSYAKTSDIPSLDGYAKTADLATVAKSGSYNDLKDKPASIDTSGFVTKDENDDVSLPNDLKVAGHVIAESGDIIANGAVQVKSGNAICMFNDNNTKLAEMFCDENGKLLLNSKVVATVDDVNNKDADINNLNNRCDDLASDLNYLSERVDNLGQGGSSGGTGGASIIDITDFPSSPSTTSIYRKWQVTKAEWVMDGVIVTDGGMTCEVVNTLPEVGEMCYTGETMYSYYQRADGECYGYVDSNLSAMMSVPVGWYPASTLFMALSFPYNGMIDSLASATDGYSLLLTKKPHLYHFYDDGKGNNVKSAIITNDNYEFDEATGTLTQHIIL